MHDSEFQVEIKDQEIEIPEQQTEDLIDQLLENPIKLDDFQPLTRQEIYG